MNSRKKKSIHQLADGILQFEDKRKSIPQADFTDLQTFLSAYLNTPGAEETEKAGGGIPETAHGAVRIPAKQSGTDPG